jgi:hypothetical protein
MWEPQLLTTLRASKACRGENFTFISIYGIYIANINNTSLHIADKNNNTTPIFIGLNKTTQVNNIKTTTKIKNLSNLSNLAISKIINIYYTSQKTRTPHEEGSAREDKQ